MSTGQQIPPSYYGYRRNTYTSITKCVHCGRTALYEDEHPVEPCPDCGHKKKEGVALWVPSQYKGFWPFRTLVESGHWYEIQRN